MNENLKILSRLFGTCTAIGFAILFLWFGVQMLPGDIICSVSGQMFRVSASECNTINFAGAAFLKVCVLVFFLLPWIAIQREIKRHA